MNDPLQYSRNKQNCQIIEFIGVRVRIAFYEAVVDTIILIDLTLLMSPPPEAILSPLINILLGTLKLVFVLIHTNTHFIENTLNLLKTLSKYYHYQRMIRNVLIIKTMILKDVFFKYALFLLENCDH